MTPHWITSGRLPHPVLRSRLVAHAIAALLAAGAGPAAANTLTIADVTLAERDAGTRNFSFAVTLDRSTCTSTVSVQYTTVSETAVAPGDFTVTSGTLVFPSQQTGCVDQFLTIPVTVSGDQMPEIHETFRVVLSNPVNATIADGTAIGTILNDDTEVLVLDTTVVEGDSPSWMCFRVMLSRATVLTVTAPYMTRDDSAVFPVDYHDTSGVVTFLQGETIKLVKVAIMGDQVAERDEAFFLEVGPATNGVVGTPVVRGGILNDDGPVTGVETSATAFALAPGVPNPMRERVTIAFTLPHAARVTLAIHALDGRRVRSLEAGWQAAGPHAATWDGRDERGRPLPSGVYFCRLAAGTDFATRRVVKVR